VSAGPTEGGTERLLTFEIGTSLFARSIASVLEVADRGTLACIPTVPANVAGVLNYRGDALPVVRRERLLALEGEPSPEPEHVLVITDRRTNTPRLGLDVDRVLGLIDGAAAVARGVNPVAEKRPIEGRVANILDPVRLVARAKEVIEDSLDRGE
jgi:chemotaxis signal transduction protein